MKEESLPNIYFYNLDIITYVENKNLQKGNKPQDAGKG